MLLNRGGWVFDDAEPRYTIGLVSLRKGVPGPKATLPLRGPFADKVRYDVGIKRDPSRFAVKDVMTWTDTAALPLLPDDASADVFAQLRKAPRLDLNRSDSWFARPHAELHATNDKKLMKIVGRTPRGVLAGIQG